MMTEFWFLDGLFLGGMAVGFVGGILFCYLVLLLMAWLYPERMDG